MSAGAKRDPRARVRAIISVDGELDAAAMDPRTHWRDAYEIIPGVTSPAHGTGHLEVCRDLTLSSADPAAWRAFAAAAVQVADQLDRLYAEHGVEPPGSGS